MGANDTSNDQIPMPDSNAGDVQARLDRILQAVRACRICEHELPLGPRPVLRGRASARLLIVGQAPGTRVHATGLPWNDASGVRLREWMDISPETFYDESRVAIVPMGYCYPGRNTRGGDLPPRKECAVHWLPHLLDHLPRVELTLLIGSYAQTHYLHERAKRTLTETVRAWPQYAPEYWPLPHPSFRNLQWIRRNPWFETEAIPALRTRIANMLH